MLRLRGRTPLQLFCQTIMVMSKTASWKYLRPIVVVEGFSHIPRKNVWVPLELGQGGPIALGKLAQFAGLMMKRHERLTHE